MQGFEISLAAAAQGLSDKAGIGKSEKPSGNSSRHWISGLYDLMGKGEKQRLIPIGQVRSRRQNLGQVSRWFSGERVYCKWIR